MQPITAIVRARQLPGSPAARAARERAGLSVAELAALVRVDRSTLARWETGATRPRVTAALRWLEALEAIDQALPPAAVEADGSGIR